VGTNPLLLLSAYIICQNNNQNWCFNSKSMPVQTMDLSERSSDDDDGSSIDTAEFDEGELPEDDELDDDTHIITGTQPGKIVSKETAKERLARFRANKPDKVSSDLVSRVQRKRLNLQKSKVDKSDRRQEVKNSLASFLSANAEEDMRRDAEEEEDESLISEEEDEHKKSAEQKSEKSAARRKRMARRGSGDCKSVGSQARRTTRRRPDAAAGSTTGGGRSRRGARMIRDIPDDGTVGSTGGRRRRSQRPPKKEEKTDREGEPSKPKSDGEGEPSKPKTDREGRPPMPKSDGEGEPSKPRSRKVPVAKDSDDRSVGSRSKPRSRKVPVVKDSDDISVGSRSKPRSRKVPVAKDSDDISVGSRSKPRSRKVPVAKDSDDISVGSRKSTARRRRPKDGEKKNGTVPESPKRPAGDKATRKKNVASLSTHIETYPDRTSGRQDPEEASEESSRFSHGHHPLLQFDPTNANNVTEIREEDEDRVTSETIKNADGTETAFQIRALAGLPTFEDPLKFNDSNASAGLNLDLGDGSGEEDNEDGPRAPESIKDVMPECGDSKSTIGDTPGGQTPGEKSECDEKIDTKRGKLKAGTRSFLQRVRKQPVAPGEGADPTKDSDKKGFFGRSKKKDEAESDEDEPKSRFGRKKRTPKNLVHQTLDDDGSD
jgi:hypothetical protein